MADTWTLRCENDTGGKGVMVLTDDQAKMLIATLDHAKADRGYWPVNDLRRAFVAGAQWWEFTSTGATMWPSDRDRASDEAERRYGKAEDG